MMHIELFAEPGVGNDRPRENAQCGKQGELPGGTAVNGGIIGVRIMWMTSVWDQSDSTNQPVWKTAMNTSCASGERAAQWPPATRGR